MMLTFSQPVSVWISRIFARMASGVVLDRAPRLLVPVVDRGAVPLQFARDAAPVVEIFEVAEADPVHEQQRISRPADVPLRAHPARLLAIAFVVVFIPRGPAEPEHQKEVDDRDPQVQDEQHPLDDPQPAAGEKDPQRAAEDDQRDE